MIYLGADHGGYELKEKVKSWLTEWGYAFEDCGAHELDPEDDYPTFAFTVAKFVGAKDDRFLPWKDRNKGILACRSAGGVIIAANKVKNVRAVAVSDITSSRHSRDNNDANVIGLSGDWMSDEDAKEVVKVWLETEFSHEPRHDRRIGQILSYERQLT